MADGRPGGAVDRERRGEGDKLNAAGVRAAGGTDTVPALGRYLPLDRRSRVEIRVLTSRLQGLFVFLILIQIRSKNKSLVLFPDLLPNSVILHGEHQFLDLGR